MPTSKEENALASLHFIIPLLAKRNFRWCITGGFACYVYGVKREITDIDIDIETSKDAPDFQSLVAELAPQTTQQLEHFVDQNYDNFNLEVTVSGQMVDICAMSEMKVFDAEAGEYTCFYEAGFPTLEIVDFYGIKLLLLSKENVIKNKEMLVLKRESDIQDIKSLRALC